MTDKDSLDKPHFAPLDAWGRTASDDAATSPAGLAYTLYLPCPEAFSRWTAEETSTMSEHRMRPAPEESTSPSDLPGREDDAPGLDAASALDVADLYGFAQLPEREFFALSLDTTLLPVELPADDEDQDAGDADKTVETSKTTETETGDGTPDKSVPGTDSPPPAPVGDPAETPDEMAILATMAKLVEEVAAETGGVRRQAPPAPATPADTPETTSQGFGADMSATLSELEKILVELTGKEPGASAPPVPDLAPSTPPIPARPWTSASRRAPRKVSRPLRAPTSVTGYALAAEKDTLLPLPDVESAPFPPETPPAAPPGPSWNKLWGAKLAHEPQAAPATVLDTAVLSFIPPEDEENNDTAPANVSTDDENNPVEEQTAGPEKYIPSAPAVSEDAPPVGTTDMSPDVPHDAPTAPPDGAPHLMSADKAAAMPHGEPEGGSGPGSRPTPKALPGDANDASRPDRPATPRGDEDALHTLAELRRLLTQLAGQGSSGALHRAPSPTRGTAPEATGKTRPRPAVSQPRPVPSPAAPPPTKPKSVTKRPDASVASSVTPPEESAPSVTALSSEAQPSAGQPGEGPVSALPVQPPHPGTGSPVAPEAGGKETPGTIFTPPASATSEKTTDQADLPSSPAGTAAAPLQPDTGAPATTPETPPAPRTWLGRLATRLKRAFRPTPSPAKTTPRESVLQPTPSTPAASTAPPPRDAIPPATGNGNESGGLIRRLREMEAEHRARLQALTERPRDQVYPSWEARRNLLNISLAAATPEPARRPAPVPTDQGEAGGENTEALHVLLDRPSLLQRLSKALHSRWNDASFRDGLRSVVGVAALTAVVGALLYTAMNPDRLDQVLESLRGLLL